MAKRSRRNKQRQEIGPAMRSASARTSSITNWKMFLLQVAMIATATLWIYWPALHGDWLWDDTVYITENAITQSPTGLENIWFEPGSLSDYYPIEASVQWMQWRLWGPDSYDYHLTNVILHLLNALLVWRLLAKLGLRLAWLGGLIFAIHPVVVESVAWVAELKNTLSLPFFLLAMCSFIDYDESENPKNYFLALGLFLVAMLCKTTMVMFPVIILLYLWWKRNRVGIRGLRLSAPFFAISLGLGLATVWFQHHRTGNYDIPIGGFLPHLTLIGLSVSFYFALCLWPADLLTMYPKWPIDPPSLIQLLPWPILVGMIGWFWMKRADWGRHALLGIGFFLINILPFAGFIVASYMRFSWVMDHFLYIPLIGLIGLAVAGIGQVEKQLSKPVRSYLIGITAAIMALMAWESHGYARLYINQTTLWTYIIEHNPNAWLAHYNLGFVLAHENRIDEAITQYQQTLKIKPDYVDALNNLGACFFQTNRIPEAIDLYRKVLKITPNDAGTRSNLGLALLQSNRIPEAIEEFEEALKINPDLPGVQKSLEEARQLQNAAPTKN